MSSRQMLCRALNLGTVVAFVGAGCSRPFDYPSWQDFALRVIGHTRKIAPEYRQALDSYRKVLKKKPRADELAYSIGACKAILAKVKGDASGDIYRRWIESCFRPMGHDRRLERKLDPHQALLDLEIKRFVTTNYDVQLENSLIRWRNLDPADRGLKQLLSNTFAEPRGGFKPVLRSFTQRSTNFEELALFALTSVRGSENAVFHCHGRFDDPESLIASEEDYQRWYLTDDRSKQTYRQTIELLLESNPLLFVGYGLDDDDLLRPLRYLNALDPARKHGRSIFALVPEPDNAVRDEVVYERYGVHVISYPVVDKQWNEGLCNCLRTIAEQWKADRAEWHCKPKVRASVLGSAVAPCQRYPASMTPASVAMQPDDQLRDLDAAVGQPGLVGLEGPSGSGKSRYLVRLLETAPKRRIFYWNAHYDTELVAGLDDAIAFFGADQKPHEPRHAVLCRVLSQQADLVLIIDGCERLLHRNPRTQAVETYSLSFRMLLDELLAARLSSTVVIAGRMVPPEITRAALIGGPQVCVLHLVRPITTDLIELGSLLAPEEVSQICSLLQGHNYCLLLAEAYLKREPTELTARFNLLVQQLAERPPNHRQREMVRLFIRDLEGGDWQGLYLAFLERMAWFVVPICEESCRICYKAATQHCLPLNAPKFDEAIKKLCDTALIFDMKTAENAEGRYGVHASARSMLLRPRHGIADDALPDFGISGFTSGRVDAYPDPERRVQTVYLFEQIMDGAEQRWRADTSPGDAQHIPHLCVDAFALLRGAIAANTAPRGPKDRAFTYERHVALAIRLVRLVKAICGRSGAFWDYREYHDRATIVDPAAPLHAAELLWLYNDAALALSYEGLMHDAYSVWEQAYEISRVLEHFKPGSGYRMEVLLNLTHVFIELGHLRDAPKYLNDAEGFNRSLADADFAGRILGLRGLLQHLGGNLPEADRLYAACAAQLRSGTNLRAQSVFLKHHGDLKLTMGALADAELMIRKSRALAEAGVFPDLVALARVSQAHLLEKHKEYKQAQGEYEALLAEARRIGSRKLEAECQANLAATCLQERDYEGARVRAMQALGLANELGLGLRLTHSMIMLGRATVGVGQRDLGIAYLRNAYRLASEQEYWHRGWHAEATLKELGEVV